MSFKEIWLSKLLIFSDEKQVLKNLNGEFRARELSVIK